MIRTPLTNPTLRSLIWEMVSVKSTLHDYYL